MRPLKPREILWAILFFVLLIALAAMLSCKKAAPPAALPLRAPAPRRIVVYPVSFSDKSTPLEGPHGRDVVQVAADRWTQYTGGRDTYDVVIAPTYHFDIPTPTTQCAYEWWNDKVRVAARAAGTPSGFFEIFFHPAIPCASHVGSAYADCHGRGVAWFNGQFSPETIAHEMGHGIYFICDHASGLSCDFRWLTANGPAGCKVAERHDRYSNMGGSRGYPFYGELEKIGVVSRATQSIVVQHSALGVHEFDLQPLEGLVGLLNVSAGRGDGNLYSVEKRAGLGLDNGLTGPIVPAFPVRLTWGGFNAYVGDLHAGERFDDPLGGISIAITTAGRVQFDLYAAPTPTPVPTRNPAFTPVPPRPTPGGVVIAPTPCYAGGIIPCTPTPAPVTATLTPTITASVTLTPTVTETASPTATPPPASATATPTMTQPPPVPPTKTPAPPVPPKPHKSGCASFGLFSLVLMAPPFLEWKRRIARRRGVRRKT